MVIRERAKVISFQILFSFLISCVSMKPQVLERADELSSTPEWAKLTSGSFEKDGKQFFLGYVSLNNPKARKSAALNMSDEIALAEPMRSIVSEFLDQNQVGDSLNEDNMVGQRVISATRGYRPPMPGLSIEKRYWETVMVPGTDGESVIELRAYSLASIPSKEFIEAKRAAMSNFSKNSEVKKILDDVGARQRDRILGGAKNSSETAGSGGITEEKSGESK